MRWYVLQSKPQKENLLYDQLCLRKIEAYYPRLHVKPINPRSRKIRPYFPGYLFVRVDLESVGLSSLQWIPGERGLILYGGEPAIVPDAIINAIRRKVDEINFAGGVTLCTIKPGDPVEIKSGPFAGYSAIFDMRLSGNDRVRILLKMLQDRQVCVELSGRQIEKVKEIDMSVGA